MSDTDTHRNAYAEAVLDRLKEDLLERIDDAERPASTGGEAGMSLAEQCDDEAPLLKDDASVEFNLAGYVTKDAD